MKKIRKLSSLLWRMWMNGCTAIVSFGVLTLLSINITMWARTGFNPDYSRIDRCLDLGGRWNYELRDCEGSESYKEWKQKGFR